MPIATNMVAGKEGWVAVGSVGSHGEVTDEIDLDEWGVDDKCDIIITKSFKLRGVQGANAGFLDTLVSFKGYLSSRTADNIYEDWGFKDGETVFNLFLGIQGREDNDIFAGLYFYFPSILVLSCKTKMMADGRVDIDFQGVPQEDFFWPGDVETTYTPKM